MHSDDACPLALWHQSCKLDSTFFFLPLSIDEWIVFLIDLCRFNRCAFISIDNVSKWHHRRQQNPIECSSIEIRTNFRLLLVFYSFFGRHWSLDVQTDRWKFHLHIDQQHEISRVDIFGPTLFSNRSIFGEYLSTMNIECCLIMSNFITKSMDFWSFCWNLSHDND